MSHIDAIPKPKLDRRKIHHFIMEDKLKLDEKDLTEVIQDPLQVFRSTIKSEFTRKSYERYLKLFLCKILEDMLSGSYEQRAKQFLEIGKNDNEKLIKIMYAYVKRMKEQTELPPDHTNYMAVKSLKTRIKPIKKFCDMNDVLFNWKRLNSTFPEDRDDYPEMRGYTKDEIRALLQFSTGPRDKAIILIAASSGIRSGAFDFTWEDVKPINRIDGSLVVGEKIIDYTKGKLECASICVYKGSSETYDALITPEAFHALLEYRKLWIYEMKHEPADSDFVFKKAGPHKDLLGRVSITQKMQKIRSRAGLASYLKNTKRRHKVPIMHGFRKFFNKTIKNTPSSYEFIGQYILRERMMGHSSLVDLDKNYYEESLLEKAEEYIKSVPLLTISDEEALKEKNKILEKEKNEMEKNLPKLVFEAVERMKHELMLEKGWSLNEIKTGEKKED